MNSFMYLTQFCKQVTEHGIVPTLSIDKRCRGSCGGPQHHSLGSTALHTKHIYFNFFGV